MSRDDMWPEDKATGVETPQVQISENKDLREALRNLVFKFAGGIDGMGDKEIDAILDTVLAHLPEESRSKYALEESGYNQALSDIKDILMSSKGDSGV